MRTDLQAQLQPIVVEREPQVGRRPSQNEVNVWFRFVSCGGPTATFTEFQFQLPKIAAKAPETATQNKDVVEVTLSRSHTTTTLGWKTTSVLYSDAYGVPVLLPDGSK